MVSDNPETFADLDGHYLQEFADAMEQDFIGARESAQENAPAKQQTGTVSILGRSVPYTIAAMGQQTSATASTTLNAVVAAINGLRPN